MNEAAPRAVFLSYAREDAEAARRIADALRAFGLEVWFDQNELRGGDQWDVKIRSQIKACALFIPIISHCTEERTEGYFRREWKFAVDRTHDMAGGRAFLVPVVIDDTPEAGAAVPEEFMKAQWTRLPGGEPSPEFVTQIKRLLEAPRKPSLKEHARPPTLTPFLEQAWQAKEAEAEAATRKQRNRSRLAIGVLIAVVVAIATAVWMGRKPSPAPVEPAAAQPAPVASPGIVPAPSSVLRSPSNPAAPDSKSIAVLPFANLSPDAANAFFADGMHDEVITALAKVRDLTVISRTSVLAYRRSEERNLRKIAAELGVAHVLEGSVQRADNRVKVIVQLIEASSDRHLWAETYVENLTDVFTIQSKLAADITAALKATLSPEEKSLIAARPTNNREAYDAYLQARALGATLVPGTPREDFDRTVALLEKAVALDPAFGRAQAELCYINGMMYWFAHLDSTPARKARAKAALDAVLALGTDRTEARMARGIYLYTCENDWAAALVELTAAESSQPNDALLVYLKSLALRRLGRISESVGVSARAIELSPQDVNYVVQHNLSLQALRRFAEARDSTTRALIRFPGENMLLRLQSVSQLQLDGDYAAYVRREETIPPANDDPHGLDRTRRVAWLRGEFDALDKILTDPRLPVLQGPGGVYRKPVSLERATVAWLRGRGEEARKFADAALADLSAMNPTPRQQPFHNIYLGLAEGLVGRRDTALQLTREGSEKVLASDRMHASWGLQLAGLNYIILGQPDAALDRLRIAASQPGDLVPELLRADPLWARLKHDPRFEEILRSIKPL